MSAPSPLTAAQAQRASLVRSFFYCLLLAGILFLPFLIIDRGFFLYCGDFNSQQHPFTYHLTQLIKEGFAAGDFPAYSWATDLGTGFVEGYSFYLLGSPFFWLGTLLPQSWTPYLLAPLLCLKFAVAGTGATLWARRYTRTAAGAELAGVLFAFCGCNIYNIFFNHFVDVAALFPFLLWSVDEFFENDRRAVFALMTALCLCVNYFFFVGQVVFILIYFVLRLVGRQWKPTAAKFGIFCFEAFLGAGMAMLIALPSFFQVITNPRVESFSSGLDLLFYWRTQQYLNIFTSAFLPQDPPYLPNLFPDASIKWTSMSLYLPFTAMAGVLTWLRSKKGHTFYRLLLTCGVMALVPVLNSAFYAFNSSYYCRWYYMPLLVMALVTVQALEESPRADWQASLRICAGITSCYLIFLVLPEKNSEGIYEPGVTDEPGRFAITLALALCSVALLALFVQRSRTRAALLQRVSAFCAALGVVIGITTIACGKFPQRNGDADYKKECYDHRLEIAAWLDEADESYYRIDTYESYTNLGLWLDRSCLQFFNSTVDPSIMEFYPMAGVQRDVSSKPDYDEYALRGLMNVKYMLMPSDRLKEFYDNVLFSEDWITTAIIGGYSILEYRNYIPFGTVYDYYITQEQYESVGEKSRADILLRALVLDEEQIAAHGDILRPLPEESLHTISYAAYLDDCAGRRAAAAESFVTDADGFTAVITTDADELVFFSVPYNKGWQAAVNGEPARVEKVDNGLCAVRVSAGESTIRFEYRAVGQTAGVVISILCAAAWLSYAALCRCRRTPAAARPALSAEEEFAALPEWLPEDTVLPPLFDGVRRFFRRFFPKKGQEENTAADTAETADAFTDTDTDSDLLPDPLSDTDTDTDPVSDDGQA